MQYSINVLPRKGSWTTYHRGGYCFNSTRANLLDESQVNDAMRADPRLVIERVEDERSATALGPLLDASGSPINDPADVREPVRCTGRTAQRKACNRWALEGSDRCADHPRD